MAEYYTRNEIAALFRVSSKEIRRWEQKGIIGYLQIERIKLYDKQEIDDLITSKYVREG